ncbi:hypothetical protein M404DRAFT_994379 [Pisolithus tinctorius Marx 270]|uniref:Uncharacterized protein n=1 Tax=Pisolithus tinctorius Marx 270 TaxID=870435 RepID=A0A0C3PSL3_PISTI|nr:hypothetical protein M404DRAFT_994379 [Pisolithus tinctorius Marx 270]
MRARHFGVTRTMYLASFVQAPVRCFRVSWDKRFHSSTYRVREHPRTLYAAWLTVILCIPVI